MSMYTHLLGAACGQRWHRGSGRARGVALAEARRCRDELRTGMPPGLDPNSVPVILAREIGYDVALIELATQVGVETDPSRFEQPARERARLEQEFAARGIDLDTIEDEDGDELVSHPHGAHVPHDGTVPDRRGDAGGLTA